MWELQPLSNNKRTTKISLLLRENTSLTFSQIPHNFMGLLSLSQSHSHSPLALSSFFLVVHLISMDALPIYRQASMQKDNEQVGVASGQVAPFEWELQEGKLHHLVLAS